MRNITQILVLCLVAIWGNSQEDFNLELVANVDIGERGNDVWGYVDSTGVEYAIMGARTTTRIWSLEDPANPIERASIPGPAGTWRDIKSFEDHLYVTSDQGTEGLLIIDMSQAPDVITSEYWKPTLTIDGIDEELEKCHNVYIDTETGICYLSGCNNGNGGVLLLDLTIDKKNPVHVGTVDKQYSHDAYAQDGKLYSSDVFAGVLTIYDVTDPSNPIELGETSTSLNFTHNAWVSDDGKYVFTTDERANGWVDAYDISDPADIIFLDRYKPLETIDQDVIPHNTHYLDGFLITSWYTDGVVIVDANKPDNLIKVAAFDTEFIATSGFNGTWGAYPYLPSGLVLGSDMNNGLFVFQPKDNTGIEGYQRASYLEGVVTDANTGAAIPNVSVKILSDDPNLANTEIMGDYRTGQVTSGEFMVEFSHPNYDSVESMATLSSGEVTILNAQLGNVSMTGSVTHKVTGEAIAGAKVVVINKESGASVNTESDEDGNWSIRTRDNNTYDVQAATWGYLGSTQEIEFTEGTIVDLEIEPGYQDDFFADLGWITSGTSNFGRWEIATPDEIFNNDGDLTQTSEDITTDIGLTFYATGAFESTGGENDVDDGNVVLTSPMMEMEEFNRIDLSYHIWFSNYGGSGNPNDQVKISITNGTETIQIQEINTPAQVWSDKIEFTISSDEIAFTDQMQIIFDAEDDNPGHVLEVGVDGFNAVGYTFTSTGDLQLENVGLAVFPNPASEYINVNSNKLWDGQKQMLITDISGKVVMTKAALDTEAKYSITNLTTGLYNVQIVGQDKKSETIRVVKN